MLHVMRRLSNRGAFHRINFTNSWCCDSAYGLREWLCCKDVCHCLECVQSCMIGYSVVQEGRPPRVEARGRETCSGSCCSFLILAVADSCPTSQCRSVSRDDPHKPCQHCGPFQISTVTLPYTSLYFLRRRFGPSHITILYICISHLSVFTPNSFPFDQIFQSVSHTV